MTSRRIGSSLVVVVLTLCGLAAPAAAADQVSFTATGTAVLTGITHLPGEKLVKLRLRRLLRNSHVNCTRNKKIIIKIV
jgi:hypothetical protein